MNYEKIEKQYAKYLANEISKEKFYKDCAVFLVHSGQPASFVWKSLGIPKSTFNDNLIEVGYNSQMQNQFPDLEPAEQDQMISLMRTTQRQSDKMRVSNNRFRKLTRLTNAVEDYTSQLISVFGSHNLAALTIQHPTSPTASKVEGILHLSDLHINEQVDLHNNKFNIEIAAKRLQKHVDHAKKVFKAYGVTNVVVAFTGDLMNSDRRLDELLMNATNRANATFVAVDILQQVILDLNKDFNVRCANVTGNESRVGKDVGWVNDIGQDNFDFMIYNTLAYIFKDSKGVTFLPPDDTFLEKVVTVADQKILLIHGHNGFAHDTDRKVASKFGQYAQRGIILNYVICGHIHSAVISDIHARSSGLVGANNYSQNALNLTGKASQNFYVVTDNGDIHGMKVDLQDFTGYDGYNYSSLSIYDYDGQQ